MCLDLPYKYNVTVGSNHCFHRLLGHTRILRASSIPAALINPTRILRASSIPAALINPTFRWISWGNEHPATNIIFFCANIIPAKPLHNSDTFPVHFNHFYCLGICDKLSKHLYMLTYIYLNVDECWWHLLCPSKCLNCKCLLIMVKSNKMWFLEVC